MVRVGEVTAVYGDMLEVTFCSQKDCGKCHACSGTDAKIPVMVKGVANVGDSAVVDMPTQKVMTASLLAYILPLAGLLGGAVLGSLIFGGDIAVAVGAVIGLGACLAVVAATEAKRRNDPSWRPVLTEVLPALKPSTPEEGD